MAASRICWVVASGSTRCVGPWSLCLASCRPPSLLEDGDTSVREGERSPHTSLAGYRTPQQHRESSSSEVRFASHPSHIQLIYIYIYIL